MLCAPCHRALHARHSRLWRRPDLDGIWLGLYRLAETAEFLGVDEAIVKALDDLAGQAHDQPSQAHEKWAQLMQELVASMWGERYA